MIKILNKNYKFDIKNTCCFTGHRPQKISWKFNKEDKRYEVIRKETKKLVKQAIKNGYTTFLSGMALGFDTMCAEIVLELKKENTQIKLVCVLPCENQASRWDREKQLKYSNILALADAVINVCKCYNSTCMQQRNEYMVNNSSLVISLFNNIESGGTYNTIRYARENNKTIWQINPEEVE